MRVADTCLERRQVVLAQVLLSRVIILTIPVSLDVVYGIVFCCSNYLLVSKSVKSTLKTRDQFGDIALGVESVFGRYFKSSSPSRVKESVDLFNDNIRSASDIFKLIRD
jgi:hypothetical protein